MVPLLFVQLPVVCSKEKYSHFLLVHQGEWREAGLCQLLPNLFKSSALGETECLLLVLSKLCHLFILEVQLLHNGRNLLRNCLCERKRVSVDVIPLLV